MKAAVDEKVITDDLAKRISEVQRIGNRVAHGKEVDEQEQFAAIKKAMQVVEELYRHMVH